MFAYASVVKCEPSTPRAHLFASVARGVPKIREEEKEMSHQLRERLRGHLIALMQEFNLNSSKFAQKTGISTGTLSNILSGEKPMGLGVFAKIRRAFPSVSANVWMDTDPPAANVPTGRTGVPVRQPGPLSPGPPRASLSAQPGRSERTGAVQPSDLNARSSQKKTGRS
jgi:transcriptional regulator with XRE-family HTH domain